MNESARKQKIVFELSFHAASRQRQRGVSNTDMELVMRYGEAVDDGFVLSDRALAVARVYSSASITWPVLR